MRYFDYSFLGRELLPAKLINYTSAIAALRERESVYKEQYPQVFTRLESIAKVQSVKGSNAIEGIITSDERINEIVNQNSAPLNHDEQEIAGYRDALDMVHNNYEALDIKQTDILGLHEIMLSRTVQGGGHFKLSDNVIMEIDRNGARHIRFEPTPADETEAEMEQLILAYSDARSNAQVNQLLLTPCFILDFLCIHPFSDGNGRMSRLLSLLLLYKNGFDVGKFISFEEQINKGKPLYSDALRRSSEGWHTRTNSYFPFIEDFIVTLLACYKELDKRFITVEAGSKKVSKRQRIEATVLGSMLPISKREICEVLPDVSPTTVEAMLGEMVRENKIEKVGAGRSTRYIKRG